MNLRHNREKPQGVVHRGHELVTLNYSPWRKLIRLSWILPGKSKLPILLKMLQNCFQEFETKQFFLRAAEGVMRR
ncbi:hypothetical protein L596_029268 [Steinernema carpocapsae]|uniref:Uncharacterized protein n=1 Tax=Steinernema carpocapsae TaxID=34508 RepID=A0A4V5ZXF4_STECR|nr:hypothetical protein L596_029268 [Steinernema carpocapsae]